MNMGVKPCPNELTQWEKMEIKDIKQINYIVDYKVIKCSRKKNRISNSDGTWNGSRVAILS